jgi:hypothetical protein
MENDSEDGKCYEVMVYIVFSLLLFKKREHGSYKDNTYKFHAESEMFKCQKRKTSRFQLWKF